MRDWGQSDTYSYANDLMRTDWACEALRRNRRFRKSWHDAQRNFKIIEQQDHLRVVGCFADSRAFPALGLPLHRPTGRQCCYRGCDLESALDPKQAGARLAALQCFNDLRATGDLVRAHLAEPASSRLQLVIQALDGDLAGASYRDIGRLSGHAAQRFLLAIAKLGAPVRRARHEELVRGIQ